MSDATTRATSVQVWLGQWIAAWLDMLCGAISVITFCAWRPWWDFTFRAYWVKRVLSN